MTQVMKMSWWIGVVCLLLSAATQAPHAHPLLLHTHTPHGLRTLSAATQAHRAPPHAHVSLRTAPPQPLLLLLRTATARPTDDLTPTNHPPLQLGASALVIRPSAMKPSRVKPGT